MASASTDRAEMILSAHDLLHRLTENCSDEASRPNIHAGF
jgi:hypothetical protein